MYNFLLISFAIYISSLVVLIIESIVDFGGSATFEDIFDDINDKYGFVPVVNTLEALYWLLFCTAIAVVLIAHEIGKLKIK